MATLVMKTFALGSTRLLFYLLGTALMTVIIRGAGSRNLEKEMDKAVFHLESGKVNVWCSWIHR